MCNAQINSSLELMRHLSIRFDKTRFRLVWLGPISSSISARRGRIMEKKLVLCFIALVALPVVTAGRVRRAPIPDECRNLEDCNNFWRHGAAFSCTEGKCMCHPQADFDSVDKNCRCKPGFKMSGNECKEDAPPSAIPIPVNGSRALPCTSCPENAHCGPNGCECSEEYVMVNNVCKKVANSVGDACEYEKQCKTKLGGFSTCSGTRCVCVPESVAVENNSTCYAKKVLGEPCFYLQQCNHVLHGTCSNDVCLCDPGFVEFNGTCIAVVDKYNENCLQNVQCQNGKLGSGSTCSVETKKCACETEYFYQSSIQQCVFAKGLDEACDSKVNNCFLPADGDKQNIQCTKSVCKCKKGFQPSEDNKQCESAGVVNKVSFFMMSVLLLMNSIRW